MKTIENLMKIRASKWITESEKFTVSRQAKVIFKKMTSYVELSWSRPLKCVK